MDGDDESMPGSRTLWNQSVLSCEIHSASRSSYSAVAPVVPRYVRPTRHLIELVDSWVWSTRPADASSTVSCLPGRSICHQQGQTGCGRQHFSRQYTACSSSCTACGAHSTVPPRSRAPLIGVIQCYQCRLISYLKATSRSCKQPSGWRNIASTLPGGPTKGWGWRARSVRRQR